MTGSPRDTLLIISQVYVPDPAAVGQYLHEVAAEMARRGHRVVVLASARGYDDPAQQYPRRERRDGVEIIRLPLGSFGKGTILIRLLGGLLFLLQAALRGLFMRRLAGVLVSTSPPMAGGAGVLISLARRVPMTWWVMDINPDQLVATGRLSPRSAPARVFDMLNRATLQRAARVITLDRFMAARLARKHDVGARMLVAPPWPLQAVEPVPHQQNDFRRAHGLADRFVIMTSGNLSLVHPLDTILDAAARLQRETDPDDPDDAIERLRFVFVGGGVGKAHVDARADRESLRQVITLPYQPLERLRVSLSAADVHLVPMGNAMVGIVHPSKVYSAMAVGRPLLLLGPADSHIGEIIREHRIGWQINHGDVDATVATIRAILATDADELAAMGARARTAATTGFAREHWLPAVADAIPLDGDPAR